MMSVGKLFNSFRARLLLVFAGLLVATLSVQYYLNVRNERNNARMRERQTQALIAGVALGGNSISSTERLAELRKNANQPLLDPETGQVANIVVVDDQWRVIDTLDGTYLATKTDDGTYLYQHLQDMKTLPPLMNAGQLEGGPIPFPVNKDTASAGESHAFSLETEDGRWYVIVVLKSDKEPGGIWNRKAARPLLYTLAVLLIATVIGVVLVWRFTRPIKDLSEAARRVKAGDFTFRVPDADRRDEMGELATQFNEMITGLGRTRELEAQLQKAEQSAVIGRLASAIAHEIRNPLNYINLTLDHLRIAFAPEDESKRETFERLAVQLKAEVARINTRISEFLNYSRPPRLEIEPLDLSAEIEDALRLIEVQAAESHIATRVVEPGDLPRVNGNAEALRSVFTNLFINAVQAIDGAGGELTVTLSTDAARSHARVEVRDTGPGIAPEDVSHLFEPYFSTKETGTGLGLAIVKKVIDLHHGRIDVQSELGHGTTFTITLPTERGDGE